MAESESVYRHRLPTRLAHWVFAGTVLLLLVTGWFIFLAHPRLYWGEAGFFDQPALWTWAMVEDDAQIGWSRSVHFLCAWLLAGAWLFYMGVSVMNRHLADDLLPSARQLTVSHILHELRDHARLRFDQAELAAGYNLLQKAAYLGVILVLIPVAVLSGLTMSPAVTADYPGLFALFGGRQSARTIHFITAAALLLFLGVHLVMIVAVGVRRELRAMITGWYRHRQEMPQ